MSTYSFVIPVLNEEGVIAELHRRLAAVADQLDGPSEFVLVDDASTDRTRELLLGLRDSDPRVKLIFLSRNFGHQLAITAGLDYASGDAVVMMDADLQDPPEVALEMAARWREGWEVVHGVRTERRGEGRFKRWTAHRFYRLLRRFSKIDLPLDAGDFRLVDRRVADVVRGMREPDRYLRGLFAWAGYRQTSVSYERSERHSGETKYSLSNMVGFAIDGLLSFSVAPLRIVIGVGFAISLVALGFAVVAALLKLTGSLPPVEGWASLAVLVSLLAGIQLIVLGMIGLYIAKAYEQGKRRPLYLVASAHGFDSPASRADHVLGAERQPSEQPFDPLQPL
ncbi:MAG: glycosyltransferase family 2 protein [Solirubrobacterales bacterium]